MYTSCFTGSIRGRKFIYKNNDITVTKNNDAIYYSVMISSTFCSDNKAESFITNTTIDPPSSQDCQLERKEEQELLEYILA